MIYYKILIRIGPHEFEKDFPEENLALACFDDLAISQDGVVENGQLIMKANAILDTVEIRRYNETGRIGDPNR